MEAPIPSQVADRLRGRAVANFDEFRQLLWKAAASVPELAGEFSAPNRALMSRGLGPKAPPHQQVPGSTIFHLVHVKHPADGGAWYDVDNIRVISPLRRYQILHYGGMPFRREDWAIDSSAIRPKLIEIVKRLLNDENLRKADASRLIDEFESNVFYPYAADLMFDWVHEFKTVGEIVDFALALEKPKQLSREELVALARRLMAADIENTVQSERLSMLFKANIPHPEGDGLIFHPKIEFKTAEDLVAHALAYGPGA